MRVKRGTRSQRLGVMLLERGDALRGAFYRVEVGDERRVGEERLVAEETQRERVFERFIVHLL